MLAPGFEHLLNSMTCLDFGGRYGASTTAPTRAAEYHNQHIHDSVDTLAWQADDVAAAAHNQEDAMSCDKGSASLETACR